MIDYNNLSDIEDEHDELGELSNLFDDLSIEGPNPEQLFRMYGIFLNDIVKVPIIINGVKVSYNRNISKHPICRNKLVAFEHIITRESKLKGKRDFDRERANKIHWIKPIIENVNDPRIKYFERVYIDGVNQQYYYYEVKGFLVIIRELKPDLLLITSFSVDMSEKNKYKKWYNEYRGNF